MSDYYNPYSQMHAFNGKWIMANFHMHNLEMASDGKMQEVGGEKYKQMALSYRNAGYGLIMHSSQRDWYDSSFLGDELGLTVINGQEHILFRDGVLLVNTDHFYSCDPQTAINDCTANGGFAILCHPNQNPDLPIPGVTLPFDHKQLSGFKNAVGVEIYNGCLSRRALKGVPFGLGLATDFWDSELTAGKLLWGFGNDDAHEAYEIHVGWTEIYAASNAFSDVKSSILKGSLVCSRGMRLEVFDLVNNTITVKAGYTYQPCNNAVYRFIGPEGKVLATCSGSEGCYHLNNEQYVRVEVIAPDGSMLWTQPVLRTDCYDLSKTL